MLVFRISYKIKEKKKISRSEGEKKTRVSAASEAKDVAVGCFETAGDLSTLALALPTACLHVIPGSGTSEYLPASINTRFSHRSSAEQFTFRIR